MTARILIGIDLGTTMLKLGAYDSRTGARVADAAERLPLQTGPDGLREQDPVAVEAALARAASSLRRRLGGDWSRVAGVGVAAQGGSATIVDRRTGAAHTQMQLWSDTRPLHLLPAIAARKPPGYWRRLSCMPDPGAGLARMEWLRARHAGLLCERNMYVGAGELIYFRLTGVWRQDAGSALQAGCYNARSHKLAPGPLQAVGVDASFVAPMRQGHEMHGLWPAGARLLQLPEGLPVAGPYMDHEAGYLSVAAASRRVLQMSLGTAWVGNFVMETGAAPDGFNLVLPSPVGAGSLVVRVMHAGTASWDWAVVTFLGEDAAPADADAVFRECLLPPHGLTALPWLTRPNPLVSGAYGGGGFFGASVHSTRLDLLRAMAAGMCYEMAHVFAPVVDAGLVDRVVLTGGAARGEHFRTILAGLLHPLPVFCVDDDESPGARGVLYSLSRRAARVRTHRVRALSEKRRRRLHDGYQAYCDLCRAVPAAPLHDIPGPAKRRSNQ